ncbi:hypothetical protein K469DRAFT_706227 [Zopfia rhizophila CBS 207.26]|uniref:Uncharacterized protein n=1 Tax=Zopfia rhizophila CBS 207.26 TaxID=1314779 RepID=A0A6A6EX99_9PEZI|nr:hypothetical protein K469DRAFT_706227 [Zopfia rhizophila CBS 207.26]
MDFDPKDLDSKIDWAAVSTNKVKWVKGKDQWIYWKECSGLTVYESNSEGKVHDKLTGQVKLQPGIDLYFVGGKVKEG